MLAGGFSVAERFYRSGQPRDYHALEITHEQVWTGPRLARRLVPLAQKVARQFRAGNVVHGSGGEHLVDVDSKIWAGTDKTVGFGFREGVFTNQPRHKLLSGGVHGSLERSGGLDRNDGFFLLDPHEWQVTVLDQLEPKPDCGAGFCRRATVLGVALTGMDVAEVKEPACVKHRKMYLATGRDVPYVKVATPSALAVDAGGHLALGGDTERADEGRKRPGNAVVEPECAVPHGATWARGMLENHGCVLLRDTGPVGGLAKRAAIRTNGHP